MPYQANSINEMQRDAVGQSLQNNPFFQPHAVPTLDNSLKTVNKKIVGAINELVVNAKKNWDSLVAYTQQTDTKIRELDTTITQMDTKTTQMDTEVATIKQDILTTNTNITKQNESISLMNQDVVAINQNVAETYNTINNHIQNHPTIPATSEPKKLVLTHTLHFDGSTNKVRPLPTNVDINNMVVKVWSSGTGSKDYTLCGIPYTTGSSPCYIYEPYELVYYPDTNAYTIAPFHKLLYASYSKAIIQIYHYQ